ncbi:MAG TPA: hypothetical protein VN680_03255 [Burkholderiaceae bacterium]|jgi:uncharacterized membrane protein|nr:hypothetical protein [Burkholderiaceae bacterium]
MGSSASLTPLGIFHTLVGLIALVTGLAALVRDKEILTTNGLGRTYLWTTLVTALTALGIFRHGSFGPPHMLALLTLAALFVGVIASTRNAFGRASHYVATLSFSATVLFHLIPGVVETFTRFPSGAPLFSSAEDPALKPVTLGLLLLYVALAVAQVLRIRSAARHGLPEGMAGMP